MQLNIQALITNNKRLILLLLVGILIIGNAFFIAKYFLETQKNLELQKQLSAQKKNEKAADFLNLFIEKVLKAPGEVSFEDRLRLENAVRDLNDDEILASWDQFTAAKTEAEAQQGVKDLLSLLVSKIYR